MNRIIVLAVLLVFSSLTNAAAISIGNPVAVTGASNTPVLLSESVSTINNDYVNAVFVDNFNFRQEYGVTFALRPQVTGFLSFNINISVLTPWNLSVIGEDNTSVFSSIVNGTQLLSVNTSLMQSGGLYNLIISGNDFVGTAGALRGLTVTIQDIAVSEVPLPAAVWLFGSVLLGGFAIRRKRQKMLSLQSA